MIVTVFLIIYKEMEYRKILIKYNVYLEKVKFHSPENIKSYISQINRMSSAFSVNFLTDHCDFNLTARTLYFGTKILIIMTI